MRKQVGRILAWSWVVATTAVLVVAVVVPRLAGATPYTVVTGSMRPGLPPGTLAVVRPTPVEEIGIGDVITYQLESGKETVVTHRVVAVGLDATGTRVLRTQGDANPAPDSQWVRPVQVRGELWYAVPHLGRVNNLLGPDQRQVAVFGIAALLLGYAALMAIGSVRDGARRRRTGEATPSMTELERSGRKNGEEADATTRTPVTL